MQYTIVRKGTESRRELGGCRTLAEILTQEETQEILAGRLVPISLHGAILSLRSPVDSGARIELRPPDPELFKMFRLPKD